MNPGDQTVNATATLDADEEAQEVIGSRRNSSAKRSFKSNSRSPARGRASELRAQGRSPSESPELRGQESGGEEFKGENQPLLFVDITHKHIVRTSYA